MYRCKECVTTQQLIYTDILLLLPIFQILKSTSLDKNAAKKEPSLLHMTILNSHSMTER